MIDVRADYWICLNFGPERERKVTYRMHPISCIRASFSFDMALLPFGERSCPYTSCRVSFTSRLDPRLVSFLYYDHGDIIWE